MGKLREPQDSGLAEVERALSILEGRHPEHERARRETLTAAAERKNALAIERVGLARRRRRRMLVMALNVVAFGVAAAVGWRLFTRAHALRDDLDLVEAPFAQAGWKEIASNVLFARPRLDVEVPASSCVVALATNGALLRVHEDGKTVEARGSLGFCTCASPVQAVVEGPASSQTGAAGLSLMRADARAVGGPLARGWVAPAPSVWGDGGVECADSTLDAWLADGHAPGSPVDDAWLGQEAARAPLRRAGFHVVADVPAGRPFGVVATPAGRCVVALGDGSELLSLRVTGGRRPISRVPGSMVWCNSEAATATVWREGASPVVVLDVPADGVGGLLGARECAAAAGARLVAEAVWLGDADLPWDAAHLLRASLRAGGPTAVVSATLPAEPGMPDGPRAAAPFGHAADVGRAAAAPFGRAADGLVALALAPEARIAWEPNGAVPACDPPLGTAATFRESVCIHPAPLSWWRRGDGMAGIARAPLPFWLAPIETWQDPAAIELIPKLLGLARQIGADGFVPTLLEGVTELADGIRVVGRANEDAVVAIGLGLASPWVFPYTSGRAWSVGESPAIVPLRPGDSVKLTASPLPNVPLDRRRTVVFRREARL